jgi:hypothetical protein
MNCPKCGGPTLQLFTTRVCDSCDPPGRTASANPSVILLLDFGFVLEVLQGPRDMLEKTADHCVIYGKMLRLYYLHQMSDGKRSSTCGSVTKLGSPTTAATYDKYAHKMNGLNILYLRTYLSEKIFVS